MHVDVSELRDFYARPLGVAVRRLLAHRIRARWRSMAGRTVIGLGFASPYLGAYREEAATLGAFMPVAQGALVWPRQGPKRSVLVEEDALPLLDNSVDNMLAVHCLEGAERVRPLLREIWRVLAPEGRLLLIVPNRRSVWARAESTPFGHGRPYSRGQLERLLIEAMLSPLDWGYALHVPPVERAIVLRSAIAFERIGSRIWPGIGGVMLVEARKELVAPTGKVRRVMVPGNLVTVPTPARVAQRRRDRWGRSVSTDDQYFVSACRGGFYSTSEIGGRVQGRDCGPGASAAPAECLEQYPLGRDRFSDRSTGRSST